MKQRRFFLLTISLFTAYCLNAQTVNDVVQFADEQFALEHYSIASKEYNRAFYFGYPEKDIISLKIAQCYYQLGQYKLAGDFFDKAYSLSDNDSLQNEAILGKSFCLLIQEEFVLTISELLNISDDANKEQMAMFHFMKGIAHYGMKNDTAAFHEFDQVLTISGLSDPLGHELETEFEKVYKYPKRYNPNRAWLMSAFVPGSGQISVGAYKEGINSLLLLGGLAVIAVRVIELYSMIDAFVTLFPWMQRYYYGGMEKSKELSFSKIEEKRYQSYLQILEMATPPSFK